MNAPREFKVDRPAYTIASSWVARRDRGLSAAEQDVYLEWLQGDPKHGRAIANLNKTWRDLDALAEWRPKHANRPNPDLLRAGARRKWLGALIFVIVGAAIVAGVYTTRQMRSISPPRPPAEHRGLVILPRSEHVSLPDGSVVMLNENAVIEPKFSATERQVRLVRGEAHFCVAKAMLPTFVIEAGGVLVRSNGATIDVRRTGTQVELIITEGTVSAEPLSIEHSEWRNPIPLVAGQRVWLELGERRGMPRIAAITPLELEQKLAWQAVRLQANDAPLSEIVPEFNLRNGQQMVLADQPTGNVRVTGVFRADNVEAFVVALASKSIRPDRRDDGAIMLHSTR